MWNCNWNKDCTSICYFVYDQFRGKNHQYIRGETYDMVKAHIHFLFGNMQ